MKTHEKKHGFLIALLFFIAIGDRITKIIAHSFLHQANIVLNDSFFSFVHVPKITALVLVGILFFICLGWLFYTQKNKMSTIALLYILLGMGSNLTDRIVYDGVIDWIVLRGISVFNIADLCIIAGVFFLFVDLFLKERNV